MQTAAVQMERHRNGCTIRVNGVVTRSLVTDLRGQSRADANVRLDLRSAVLSTEGVDALQGWYRAAEGSLELVLPDAIAALVPPEPRAAGTAIAGPPQGTPVDLPALLAHELRGPLAVAHLRMQTLAARLAGRGLEEEASNCRHALAGLDAVSRLFDTYLTASRPWRLRPLDLEAICAAAAAEAQEWFGRGRVAVRSESPTGPPWTLGEPQALHQLVLNLTRNALEADPGGNVDITLQAPGQEPHVHLYVRDGGPGFPAEVLDAPFRPRASVKAGGMGIGLVLCKWIVERHHGDIQLENGDAGALVRLRLRRCTPGGARRAPAANHSR